MISEKQQSGVLNSTVSLENELAPPAQLVTLIERDQILQQLDEGLTAKLTIIQAPAGFGKTTLLAQWRSRLLTRGVSVAWISLDQRHSDPYNLLAIISVALHGMEGQKKRHVQVASELSAKNIQASLERILMDVSSSDQQIVLMLDEFERCDNDNIIKLFSTLINLAPANFHIAIASRNRPRMPLTQLMARGYVRTIAPIMLRFTPEDAQRLLGETVSAEEAERLIHRTGGWVVILQLIRLLLESGERPANLIDAISPGAQNLAEYLSEQVFSGLSSSLNEFLVEISFLELIIPELADAIRGKDDSYLMLEQLKKIYPLVTPEVSGRHAYRLHPLLREYLYHQLSLRGTASLQKLHLAAAHWYMNEQQLYNAVHHAILADDMLLAVDIFEAAGAARLAVHIGLPELKTVLELFPNDVKEQRIRVGFAYVIILVSTGNLVRGERLFGRLISHTPSLENTEANDELAILKGDVLLTELYLIVYKDEPASEHFLDKIEKFINQRQETEERLLSICQSFLVLNYLQTGMLHKAERIIGELDNVLTTVRLPYQTGFLAMYKGMSAYARGDLSSALTVFSEIQSSAQDRSDSTYKVVVQAVTVLKAVVLLEKGEMTLAQQYLESARPIATSFAGWFDIFTAYFAVTASLSELTKGSEFAIAVLDNAEEEVGHPLSERLAFYILALRCEIQLRSNQADEQAMESINNRWLQLQEGGRNLSRCEWDQTGLTLARKRLLDGDLDGSQKIIDEVHAAALTEGRRLTVIRTLISMVMLHHAKNDPTLARATLKEALLIALDCDSKWPFLKEGKNISSLLSEIADNEGEHKDLGKFTLAILSARKTLPVIRGDINLTHREHLILVELCKGYPNKTIARNLDMSVNTVKHHLKNVFKKIGANNRKAAIERAMEKSLHI